MKQEVKIGQTDYTALVLIRDTAGAPKTALTFESAGLDFSYTRVETDNDVVLASGAPATQTLTGAHSDWGFVLVSDTDAPGLYRLDLPDGVFAAGAWSAVVSIIGTGLDPTHLEFVLVPEAPVTGVVVSSFSDEALKRMGVIAYGTAQSAGATSLVLAAASAFANDELLGATIVITGGTTGVGQARTITDYTLGDDTATVDAWTTTPTGTITYVIFATPPSSVTAPLPANVTQWNGTAVHSPATAGVPEVNVHGVADNAITAAALSDDAVDAILDEVVEGAVTVREMLRGFAAALLSKVSGAGTTTMTFRDIGDTKNRIVATVDTSGNRSAITLTLT